VGTVRYLAPDTDAYVASVQRHVPEFEEQTGHRLEIRILGSDEYFSNRIGPRLGGDDAADVFMSGPVLLWEHVGAGLVEPLESTSPRSTASSTSATSCRACSRSTAGPAARETRSAADRCCRFP
jgi:hypothetical protein